MNILVEDDRGALFDIKRNEDGSRGCAMTSSFRGNGRCGTPAFYSINGSPICSSCLTKKIKRAIEGMLSSDKMDDVSIPM